MTKRWCKPYDLIYVWTSLSSPGCAFQPTIKRLYLKVAVGTEFLGSTLV
jgi:hypothetical protein